MPSLLTWKRSTSGTLHAAYRGRVRIGYVQVVVPYGTMLRHRHTTTYLWTMHLLKQDVPDERGNAVAGGSYCGRCDTLQEAMDMCEGALRVWLEQAELMTSDECDELVWNQIMED